MPPIGGRKRKVSGIEPQPSPMISQSSVQTASFWKTIGSVHQSPKSPSPPSPGVVAADHQGGADREDDRA